MKPQLLKKDVNQESSFSVREEVAPYLYNRLHYHPEVELTVINKGTGTQFIGDHISRFKNGDVILVGSGLPHYWRCDDSYFKKDSKLKAKATAVHFTDFFWGDAFLKIPENKKINELLKKAQRGIKIPAKIKKEVIFYIEQMLLSSHTKKIILLLSCLELIANTPKLPLLSSAGFYTKPEEKENDRINDIYNFTLNNFKKKISIAAVSKISYISPNSFCRYFKLKTRKNYSRFLNEIRVGHACKLLMESNHTISQICVDSGFNNIVNFHRYFKIITGKTPYQYKKDHGE